MFDMPVESPETPAAAAPARAPLRRASFIAAAVAAAGLAWIGGAAPALAANAAVLTTTVTPIPDEVSINRPGLATYAAYRVVVENTGGNTVNQVVATFTTSVRDATGAVLAGLHAYQDSVVYPGTAGVGPCPQPASGTVEVVTCSIGQLSAHETSTFYLVFKAPAAGAKINLRAHTDFSEGNSSGAPPANVTADFDTLTTLRTFDAPAVRTNVKSVLPKAGGSVYTGVDAIPTGDNPQHTTNVVVPNAGKLTNNEISETQSMSVACAPRYFCFGLSTDITVFDALSDPMNPPQRAQFSPSSATTDPQYITVTIRQAAASVASQPGTKIADVKIFYSPDLPAAQVRQEVQACAVVGGVPQPPAAIGGDYSLTRPCIALRTAYPKKYALNPALAGVFEYVFYTWHNGKWDM